MDCVYCVQLYLALPFGAVVPRYSSLSCHPTLSRVSRGAVARALGSTRAFSDLVVACGGAGELRLRGWSSGGRSPALLSADDPDEPEPERQATVEGPSAAERAARQAGLRHISTFLARSAVAEVYLSVWESSGDREYERLAVRAAASVRELTGCVPIAAPRSAIYTGMVARLKREARSARGARSRCALEVRVARDLRAPRPTRYALRALLGSENELMKFMIVVQGLTQPC